jgi:regulator of nucleoside diphosphate kinase
MTHAITITNEDRRRLGTMLQAAHSHGVERREYLHALETELERAHAADPAEVPDDVVTMNSTVELRDLDTGEVETCTIVYPERADDALDRISVLAPIGTAILGCRIGDVVRVRVPSGRRRIRIEEIHFQPERAGDYHL